MKHYDYDWDLYPEQIIFDPELDIDKLGWKHGDYFRITNINGQAKLVKCDPLVKFLKDGEQLNAKQVD
jgi:anaerobic selenocysteine-containing dehydrogenase